MIKMQIAVWLDDWRGLCGLRMKPHYVRGNQGNEISIVIKRSLMYSPLVRLLKKRFSVFSDRAI